jgi:hypothetical protein
MNINKKEKGIHKDKYQFRSDISKMNAFINIMSYDIIKKTCYIN